MRIYVLLSMVAFFAFRKTELNLSCSSPFSVSWTAKVSLANFERCQGSVNLAVNQKDPIKFYLTVGHDETHF